MIALLSRALKWLRFPVFVGVITNKPNIPAGTNIIEGIRILLVITSIRAQRKSYLIKS
jgi:hypothetical protein